MPTGIYTAYSGAEAAQADLDVIANNVANSTTAGFRRDVTQFDTVFAANIPFVRAARGSIDLSPAAHRLTGNPLNAAIDGEGLFVVQTADGDELYTRRGDFRLDAQGRLALPNGLLVSGAGGALVVPPGESAELRRDGSLVTASGVIGRLRVVTFDSPGELSKAGESLIRASENAAPRELGRTAIAPGFVEGSNVNIAAEMVAMITAQRSFEAAMRAIQINDELTSTLIQSQQ